MTSPKKSITLDGKPGIIYYAEFTERVREAVEGTEGVRG